MTSPPVIYVYDMQEGRHWGDCPMCEQERRLDHAVGWYCGPTHDEIGSISTEYRGDESGPAIVGGMCICKACHDSFYGVAALSATSQDRGNREGEGE